MGDNSWNGYEYNCLFSNVGDGQFVDIARPTGADGVLDGRGVATADFNGDGRIDLAINNNNRQPTLYLNQLAAGNWLRLDLIGESGNRDAVGAKVRVSLRTEDGSLKTLTRWVEAGSGYASQSAFPVHFGLGNSGSVDAVEITWPGGSVTRIEGSEVAINQQVRVEEVAGLKVAVVDQPEVAPSHPAGG